MDFGEHIRALFQRSGLGKEEYAAKIGGTRSHIINVINGKWPGSLKTFEKCCEFHKIQPESCFVLPLNPATEDEDKQALATLRTALSNGGVDWMTVHETAFILKKRMKDRRAKKLVNAKQSASDAEPLRTENLVAMSGRKRGKPPKL